MDVEEALKRIQDNITGKRRKKIDVNEQRRDDESVVSLRNYLFSEGELK